MKKVRRFQDGGLSNRGSEYRESADRTRATDSQIKALESYMARQGMSETEKNSLRRSLNIPSPAPSGGARPPSRPSLSPLAKAAKQKKKTPLVPRPRTTAQRQPAPRQQVAPPPPPPAPAPSVQQPPQDEGMLGETMNAIQRRQQMLQGLKRGGPVKKKTAPRRVVRAKRRR